MASDEPEPSSGDYMVLEHESASLGQQLSTEQQEEQRKEAIVRLCGMCGEEDGTARPLRVVVVGKHGAGKSSFINSVAAALSEDKWHEYATTGYRRDAGPITIVNQRHVKCCNGHRERYKGVLLPTLIDVAGLGDDADDKTEELLRLLFYGHIQEDKPIMQVHEDCRKMTTEDIRRTYSQSYSDMRVDRVIFVTSAADNLPTRLMTCVYRAAQPAHHRQERRAVPLYGVMTRRDKVDENSSTFRERREGFMRELGLILPRLLVCSNYCDDLDPLCQRTETLRPDLDLPIVRFMQQVCDKARRVTREEEHLPGSTATPEEAQNAENAARQAPGPVDHVRRAWSSLDSVQQDLAVSSLVALVTLLVLVLVLPSPAHDNVALAEGCRSGLIKDFGICSKLSHSGGVVFYLKHVMVAALVSVFIFLTRHFARRA